MATVTGTKRHLIIESDTLNTGQGANELYSMDQDVTTRSNVTFAKISATSLNVTSITSSIVTSSILKTEGSNIFGDASNDTHTFNGNIIVTGTVDGRDIATDGTKLDGIASSANNYSLPLASSTRGGVKIGYTENGKNYPVELSSEKMFVNVPWTDTNTTYSVGDGGLTQNNFTNTLKSKLDGIATSANNYSLPLASSTRGGVKIGYTENGKNYPVELSSEKMYVNVPWTDTNTTYSVGDGGLTQKNFTTTLKNKLDGIASSANNYSLPAGSSSTRGGFKIGYSENGKNYPVEVSSEKMFVNVPWTDNNDNTQLSTEQVQDIVGAMFSSNTETRVAATYDDTSGKIDIVVDDMTADTNTTYSVGDGGLTQKNFTTTLKNKLDGIATSANNYSLPTAAANTLGGIKVGTNLSINGSGVLSSTNTTYSVGDGGLTQKNFTTTLKNKLDGIASSANNYSLPLASSTRGGVKIGYTENGKNYPVELSSEKMFVNVPWTDTNTTYSVGDGGLTQKNFTTTLKNKLDGIATNADVTPEWVPTEDPRYGTSNLALGTTSTTALRGDTTTISNSQASAITTNTAKVSYDKNLSNSSGYDLKATITDDRRGNYTIRFTMTVGETTKTATLELS